MGSPAYWGKLAAFTASLRKPALVAFGTFNAQDKLGFIADIPNTTPITLTTANGTITGTLNGVNAVFILTSIITSATVYRNGVLMTPVADYTFTGGNTITFVAGQIPQSTDILTVEGLF